MSKLKDKLSANMRTVKASQEPAAAETVKPVPETPAAKPAVTSKPASKAAAGATTLSGEVPQSGTALFPTRIWPD